MADRAAANSSLGDGQKRALSLSQISTVGWRRFEPRHESAVSTPCRTRKRGLLPTLVLAMLAIFAVSGLETFSVNPERPAAVLFPGTMSEEQAFAAVVAAGGLPVRLARSTFSDGAVWIAAPGAPDFFSKVKSYGAWAVINPFAFGGCFLVKPV
jgi:hypothetical protein